MNITCDYLKANRVRLSVNLLLLIILFFIPAHSYSKDYPVTYIKEQYKISKEKGGEGTEVYHTWCVNTAFGMKLLILTGDDTVYRKWLREFTKEYDLFLVKVPNTDVAIFEEDTVFKIDLNNLHPVDRKLFEKKEDDKGKKKRKRRR